MPSKLLTSDQNLCLYKSLPCYLGEFFALNKDHHLSIRHNIGLLRFFLELGISLLQNLSKGVRILPANFAVSSLMEVYYLQLNMRCLCYLYYIIEI